MGICYQESSEGVTAEHLKGGFCVGWRKPRTPAEHLTILQNSSYVMLARDESTQQVVGFVTVLTDDIQAAFVSLLEVLPDFQGRGVGSTLMKRVIDRFGHLPALDLTCRPELQTFYARFGMQPSVGAIRRNYFASEETP